MSKPRQRKSGSKSKKRTPARKPKPKCGQCNRALHMYSEIDIGYCTGCLTRLRSLDPSDTLLNELRSKEK